MTKIVVVNDDGPRSPGLMALVKALEDVGDVLVFVPDGQRSGAGKSITLSRPVVLRERDEGFYLISGTPADAVLVALKFLEPRKPDVVVSGINMSPNLGLEDFFQSGTIGAAIQAALHHIPAVAVSYAMGEGFPIPSDEQIRVDLKLAARLAAELVKAILVHGMPEGVDMLSVNVPVGAKLDKIAITGLLRRPFWKAVGHGKAFRILPWPSERPSGPEGSDLWAVLNGYISITPIGLGVRCEKEVLRAFLEECGFSPTLI